MTEPTASPILPGSWDVIVVGAGPAGSAAASACSKLGLKTLLVDKASFPRDKVCGGCLSPAGVQSLRDLGAFATVRKHAIPVEGFRLLARGRSLNLALSGTGLAVGRETLDLALLNHAQSLGATVQQGCAAALLHSDSTGCRLRLLKDGVATEVQAKAVIVADGLAGSFLPREAEWTSNVARNSRFGVGSRIPAGVIDSFTPDRTITMHCGKLGYLGLMRLQDGSIDAAAALDPAKTKALGGPGAAVASILSESLGHVPNALSEVSWHGTPLLTRRRKAEAPGIFIVGDAAAYVEPFTGEGMSWALRGGMAVAEYARDQCQGSYAAGAWTNAWSGLTGKRRWACSAVAATLRSPKLVSGAMGILEHIPAFNSLAQRMVAGPWHAKSKVAQSA